MFSADQLPVPERARKSTDVCCTVVGAIFALVMFVLACIWFSKASLNNTYFPDNSLVNGVACPSGLLSYSDATFKTSSCVTSCGAGFFASNGFCMPSDPALLSAYTANKEITRGWDYSGFKWTLFYAGVLAISIGLLWMMFVHCFPRFAPIVALIGAALLLLVIGIVAIVSNSGFFSSGLMKIEVIIIAFLLMIILIVMACVYANEVKFQGIMLDYARRFLSENPLTFLYIPLYILFTLGLFALFVFQHCAFSSRFATSSNFFNWANPGFWGVLNILEFIWAFQFLRDSFNFCVSGNAVDWYWTGRSDCSSSYMRLICRNWGSVVAGSFLNAFFEIPTLIVELFVCHPNTCCSKLGTTCANSCSCCTGFFNLVRTDAYSYINLTGIPFCNSARECERLCSSTNQFVGSHSAMKHYRFAAHVFLVCLTLILAYLILRVRTINPGFFMGVTLLVVIYCLLTWFIDIHADAAEGLQTSFLAEQYTSGGYEYMQHCIPSYRKELTFLGGRKAGMGDGNC